MRRFLAWLFHRKRVPTPEQRATMRAYWLRKTTKRNDDNGA